MKTKSSMPELKKPISLVFAEDHELVREGFVSLFSLNKTLKVVGQCGDGLAALQMIQTKKPDFAIIDLGMPKLGGLELIRKLRQAKNACKLVVLSMSRDEQTAAEALRAGADGYIPKDDPSRHLLDAIQYIRDGGVYISPLLPNDLMSPERMRPDPLAQLSDREQEVFYYLVNGFRAKENANMLDISPKTVDTHRAHLMQKLGINDRGGLVKFAIKRKLISE
jgi:DNA-binding NarL/FixJ family response regulator